MRQQSREKFEDKLKELTTRSHNFDAKVIEKLNQVIRGTVNYFCTGFSSIKKYLIEINKRMQRRLRSMKYKRTSRKDNYRLKTKIIKRRGLVSFVEAWQHAISRWCSQRWPMDQGKHYGVAH